jgi:hypothetical protein
MKYLVLPLLFLVVFLSGTRGQDLEFGVFGGGAYYLGDLNPSRHFQSMNLAFGVQTRYNINTRMAVKLSYYRGKVEGSAAGSYYLPERNLQFSTPVNDISAVAEFNFFRYFTGSRKNFITPYIYGGIGMMITRPESDGFSLQPLGTEGQNVGYDGRKPYSLVNLNFPFGMGVKVSVSNRFGITAFWEMHKTLTDYIDDVSKTYYLEGTEIDPKQVDQYMSDPTMSYSPGMQRGNSKNQDWYSFTGITISYKFALYGKKRCREPYSN